jgi:hypothetical protein
VRNSPDLSYPQAQNRQAIDPPAPAEDCASEPWRTCQPARHYIEELDAQSLTSRIDAVIDLVGEDEPSSAAVSAGRRMLATDTDEW